ncbi:hypothetical protein JCM15519_29140 [Fundidesulfovibrio butyratiphilus]
MKRIAMIVLVLAVSAHYAWSAPAPGPWPGPMPCGPGPMFAGPGPMPGPGPERLSPLVKMAEDLGLSAEQKHSVALLLKKNSEPLREAGQAMRKAMETMHKAMEAETFNETAIKEANKAVCEAGEKMALLSAKERSDFRALLTPEQRAEMDKKMALFRERMEKARLTTEAWIERYAK